MSSEHKTPADLLKANGIDAKRGPNGTVVSVYDVYIPGEGHPLDHPRRKDPLDGALLYDIATRGVQEDVVLWREGVQKHDNKMRLTLIDGCQRVNHLFEACLRMQKGIAFRVLRNKVETGEEQVIPWKDGRQYLPVEFHVGDLKSAILRRLGENTDPFKRPDSAAVLAAIVKQARLVHCTDEEILSNMPRDVDAATLAALDRWDDLSVDAKKMFADGAHVGLLTSVIDLPRDEQSPALAKYVEAGVKTKMGASRVKNRVERAERGDLVEGIRRPVLKRILEVVRPTPADVLAAQETVEGSRSKGMADAHDTLAAYYFDLGGRVMSGDMKALEEIPCEDLKRRLKAALKKEGKVPGKTGKRKKK